jgi:SAM-dependent methyltransferase
LSSKKEIYKRNDCRLCGSKDLELILSLTPTPPGDLYLKLKDSHKSKKCYPNDLYICRECGYVHLRDTLSASLIYPEYLYETTSSSGLIEHFADYAKEVKLRLPTLKNGLAIDIGSNDGTLLAHLKKEGFKTLGVDPAKVAAVKAQEHGIETIVDFFNQKTAKLIANTYEKAKIITANNVFANIDDIDEFVNAAKSILCNDGVFIIEFAYLGDLIEYKIFDYIYHEHLSYFSIAALEKFFLKHEMQLLHLSHTESKGGSFRAYFSRINNNHIQTESVEQERVKEQALQLENKHTYTQLDQIVLSNAKEVRDIIHSHKKSGGRCIGYGASVTCTTLLYHFGIGDQLDYLVDDNPAKIGTVSPGFHLPVYSADRLKTDKPDLCIMLAWRYANEIYMKNVYSDTRFLIPMPRVEWL